MADDDKEEEAPTILPLESYEDNDSAFSDAWAVAEALSRRFYLDRFRPRDDLATLIRAYHLRLRRSPDHVILARIVRTNRLLPDQLAVVLMVLQDNYMPRARSIGEIFLSAAGFHPPRIDRLWRWMQRSPLIAICGPQPHLHPGHALLHQVEGGMPINEEDFFSFVRLVAALQTADRTDIPDNQRQRGETP